MQIDRSGIRFGAVNDHPQDSLARAIAAESDQSRPVIPIEVLDGIVESAFRILVQLLRQRIVDSRRPTIFFESHQNGFLIRRCPAELLDDTLSEAKLFSLPVPARLWRVQV